MKQEEQRIFRSLEEIRKAYMPDSGPTARPQAVEDPVVAGEKLAKCLLETMRSKLASDAHRK